MGALQMRMLANTKAIAVCICVLTTLATAEVVNPADALVEEDAVPEVTHIHGTAYDGDILPRIRSGRRGLEEGRVAAEQTHAEYQKHSRTDLSRTEMQTKNKKKYARLFRKR